MGVHIDPPRRQQETVGIEDPVGAGGRRRAGLLDGLDHPTGDGDVGHALRPAAAVDQPGVADDEFSHAQQ
ncbi:hypothetical protein GCM10009836_08000 [Pseudonocardia ailaonensis]|uniref:Uncharacterized protein n=1 Tax=Pseudonocardia ailaonensis TaxID=367279 RepID=A0ABN2MNH8_9PSEU